MGLKFWNKPCYTCGVKKSIGLGFLVDYVCYGTGNGLVLPKISKFRDFTDKEIKSSLDKSKIPTQVNEIVQLSNAFELKKVCVIASGIDHATDLHEEFSKYEKTTLIHSKIKNANDLIEEYKNDETRFSISIGMIAEGFDCPKADGIVLLRATNSSRLLTQIIGRGLRLYPGKKKCIVLDYSGSVMRCGDPKNPIIPQPEKKSEPSEPSPIKQCEECYIIYDRIENGKVCPSCGHIHKTDMDVESNLKKSILKSEFFHVDIGKENLYKFGVTKNGAQFLTVKVGETYHTLFSYQRKALLGAMKKTGVARLTYTKEGKFKFKFCKAQSV